MAGAGRPCNHLGTRELRLSVRVAAGGSDGVSAPIALPRAASAPFGNSRIDRPIRIHGGCRVGEHREFSFSHGGFAAFREMIDALDLTA